MFRPDRIFSAFLICLVLTGGCSNAPLGPAFRLAPAPPENRARVYLYRSDEQGSLATVRITIDGLKVGEIRNGEYETIELSAGTHQIRAGMRGFGLLAWGWNKHRFRVKPGETAYRKLSVRLTARAAPATRELEIGGRTSGAASENVFIVPISAQEALLDLAATTRLPHTKGNAQ